MAFLFLLVLVFGFVTKPTAALVYLPGAIAVIVLEIFAVVLFKRGLTGAAWAKANEPLRTAAWPFLALLLVSVLRIPLTSNDAFIAGLVGLLLLAAPAAAIGPGWTAFREGYALT